MHILSVKDPAFRKYGRVITNVDFTQLVEEMKKTPVPDGVVYEPGMNALEALPVKKELETITYGEMPVQIGYCNGHNSKLNAVEYHRSSEINVAATDAILILGLLADVAEDFTYDTSKMEAFLVPAGTEIYTLSLHDALPIWNRCRGLRNFSALCSLWSRRTGIPGSHRVTSGH